MRQTRFLVAAALAAATLAVLAADLTQLAPEKSAITFVSQQMNVPVEGKFNKFSAQLTVNPAKPETGKVEINIDLASIDTGSKDGNDEVKSKNWFNTAQFPRATFTSTAVAALGNGKYEATGKMNIKGTSREVRVPFTVKPDATGALFEGAFTLRRLQFKVGEGLWTDTDTVNDEVQIRFRIYARK